jgi:hypothetical protein
MTTLAKEATSTDMDSAVPGWLAPVAWAYIALSLTSAALIAFDIYLRRLRHGSAATQPEASVPPPRLSCTAWPGPCHTGGRPSGAAR